MIHPEAHTLEVHPIAFVFLTIGALMLMAYLLKKHIVDESENNK